MKYEVPAAYEVLKLLWPVGAFFEPPYLLVKLVCDCCVDESLSKDKFYRYLEDYKVNGLYCKRGMKLTAKRERYYKGIRENKIKYYLKSDSELKYSFRE